MIGIKLEDEEQFLDTLKDTTIEMTLENPLLGDADRLSPGSFTLPFNLPAGDASPKNAALLKNPDVVENNEAYEIQKADLYYDQVPFKSGNLKAKSSVGNRLTAHFTFGLSSLSADLKTKKVREVLDEVIVIDDTDISREIYITKADGTTMASIEVNGQVFSDVSLSGLSVLIQDYFTTHMVPDGGFWLPYSDLIFSGTTPGGLPATYMRIRLARHVDLDGFILTQFATDPHLELYVKIDQENSSQFEVEGFDMTDYYAGFNAFSDARLKFPIMFNADLHEPDINKELFIINAVDVNGLVQNDPNYGHLRVRNINSIQPFLLLKHVLDAIADYFGFSYEGDFYEEADLPTMLIDNSQTLDLPMDYIGEKKFIFWRRSFNLNELVEDVSVVDFFKKLAGRYNLGIYYNEATRKVRLKKREAIALSKEFEDITGLSSPIDPSNDERVTGFKLIVEKESSDAFSTDETLTVGTAENKYEIKCGRLHLTKSGIYWGGLVSGPYTSRRNGAKFGFRIFHYKGIIDNGEYEYPAADISGTEINEQLAPLAGIGLYLRFWKYWLLFDSNRKVISVRVNYPYRLLRSFDFEKKRRFDRSDFLVKSIRVRLTNQRIEVSDVQLLTMR